MSLRMLGWSLSNRESPHDWLVRLAMNLHFAIRMWSLTQVELIPFGHKFFWVKTAHHFKATQQLTFHYMELIHWKTKNDCRIVLKQLYAFSRYNELNLQSRISELCVEEPFCKSRKYKHKYYSLTVMYKPVYLYYCTYVHSLLHVPIYVLPCIDAMHCSYCVILYTMWIPMAWRFT